MDYSFERIRSALEENIDINAVPDSTRKVCIVSGDFTEMGRQYGKQMSSHLRINLLHIVANARRNWNDTDLMMSQLALYEAFVQKISPESIELWQGIAEGAQLPYEAIVTYCCYIALKAPKKITKDTGACSTIAAWNNATRDNELITAANADGPAYTPTSFSPTLIMYPKNGHALISNGGICANLVLNDCGLVIMASAGGWGARAEDQGLGVPGVLSPTLLSWKYADARAALDEASQTPASNPENIHFVDASGAYVLERTAGHHAVRVSGDNGEKDYMITNNHFISDEMQASRPENDQKHHNSYSRYVTEEQLIKQQYGALTVQKMGDILRSHDRYDKASGWIEDEWDKEKSIWTPEKHGPNGKTYMQTLSVPSKKLFYIVQGQGDIYSSSIPGATGRFARLTLEKTSDMVLLRAEEECLRRGWLYAKKLSDGDKALSNDCLNEAKSAVWRAKKYRSLGELADTQDQRMFYHSLSATEYVRAQALLGMEFEEE